MNVCLGMRRYYLISFCIATLILGQPSSLPTFHQDDAPYSVRLYVSMASLAYLVPNGYDHQFQNAVLNDGGSFNFSIPGTDQAALRPSAATLPSIPLVWYGIPPLRSPPFSA